MGRTINLDARLSQEDREYLEERGRGYLIPANERRFGTEDDPHEPLEGDDGPSSQSPFYDNQERAKAVYDVGGAPLPGTVLDHDTGRVADRDNGVLVEYTGPGHTPGAYDLSVGGIRQYEPEGFESRSDDGDDIDDDIVQKVLDMPNVAAIKKELAKKKVELPSGANREDLENLLAVTLQDERDAKNG